MKSLNDYINDDMSRVFKENGAFFAFSNEQFEKQKIKGVEYVNLEAGLICPKGRADKLTKELDKVIIKGVKQDLQENGKDKIIKRELANREFDYNNDFEEVKTALKGYNITEQEILAVIKTL